MKFEYYNEETFTFSNNIIFSIALLSFLLCLGKFIFKCVYKALTIVIVQINVILRLIKKGFFHLRTTEL
jgi:hypothetical protein